MNYSDFISINKNFQASINLELDLGNEKKIEEYIPTTDICDVIKKYIKTALGEAKDFSTTLVGPYGKGKSFLLLVLTFLLGKNKDSKAWEGLVNKIKKVDSELFEMLQKIKNKNINLLPIIINSNYDNITQSFQLALNEALKREKLDDIVPNSVFDICLSILDKWESKEDLKEETLKKCVEVNKIDLNDLRKGLINLSPLAYKQFESLYNCINIGLGFNPLINNDVVKTYSNILVPLSEKGYTGIFIIFDEFSKFLESSSSDLMKDLKIVQDFAELSSRSGKNTQIHLCCVTHKSIGLYKSDKKSNDANDSFKTVEGRFKEIRFNRSLNENYQLISSALIRKENLYSLINDYVNDNNSFVNEMYSLNAFKDKSLQEILFKDCFPLNPLTVYSLVQICELVAQNERTLFTFLSDTDDDSFNSFIHSKHEGLFDVDKVYDYFSQLFKKEDSGDLKNVWYRTESILSKLETIDEKRVIKTLSIISIINNFDEFPPTAKAISLALELPLKEVATIVNSLIDKHYIRENLISHYLSFALSSSKQIDEAVEVLKNTKCKNLKFNEIANKINEKKFALPRKYNEENKITRFYKITFLSEEDFLKIPSFDYYFEQNYCDGLIVYLLKEKLSKKEIESKSNSLNDIRIVVKYPNGKIKKAFYDSLTYLACLKEYKKQKGLDEIVQGQVELILQEVQSDAQALINEYFENDFGYYHCGKNKDKSSFNQMLSNTMDEIYSYKLIFNNELMNKKEISTQYQKAINHVIDWLLDGQKTFPYSETSPEYSIKYAALDHNDIVTNRETYAENLRKIIESLKEKLIQSDGKKISVKNILSYLSLAPYGVKDGVLPIIFAKAISELSDNAIIYYQQKEVELNSSNIVKAVKNENYQISFAKGSAEQKEYLANMLALFEVAKEDNFRRDTFALAKNIKKFFIGLPQIIRVCSKKNNYLALDEKLLDYKALFMTFDVNPYESVFVKPLEIFNTKSYAKAYDAIKKIVDNKDVLLFDYYKKIINSIKEIFDISEQSSLKSGFKDFIENNLKQNERPILEETDRSIFNLINLDFSYNDTEGVEKLSKIITSQHIEDWDNDKLPVITESLKKFKATIESSETISESSESIGTLLSQTTEIDGMSSLLKNNIESILDEFSGSVSSKEKANVLLTLLKDLL